jgi:hypothetical protein
LKLRILEIQAHARGKIYKISADDKIVSILLTFHALERTILPHFRNSENLEMLLRHPGYHFDVSRILETSKHGLTGVGFPVKRRRWTRSSIENPECAGCWETR